PRCVCPRAAARERCPGPTVPARQAILEGMCRLLGYLGESVPLGALVSAPAHSLLRQSWQARELVSATVNADGWGAGLYVEGDPAPCLYASTLPIWADANLPHLGRA